MQRFFRALIGLVIFTSVGFIYGSLQSTSAKKNEPKQYALISVLYANNVSKLILLKETPQSECEKWRSDYADEVINSGVQSTILINECVESFPEEYQGVFEKAQINHSYIYKEYGYPEVIITEGFNDQQFNLICQKVKSEFSASTCIEKL